MCAWSASGACTISGQKRMCALRLRPVLQSTCRNLNMTSIRSLPTCSAAKKTSAVPPVSRSYSFPPKARRRESGIKQPQHVGHV